MSTAKKPSNVRGMSDFTVESQDLSNHKPHKVIEIEEIIEQEYPHLNQEDYNKIRDSIQSNPFEAAKSQISQHD